MAQVPKPEQIAAQKRLIIVALRNQVPENLIREAFFDRDGEPMPPWTWSRRLADAMDENAVALAESAPRACCQYS